jgi:hypothetical protein
MTYHEEENKSIYLFVAPNTTIESALYVVENCAPIGSRPINASGHFAFPSLPVGRYVVAVYHPYPVSTQGFPVVHEFNATGFAIEAGVYGGNTRYSLATFSIHPIP